MEFRRLGFVICKALLDKTSIKDELTAWIVNSF